MTEFVRRGSVVRRIWGDGDMVLLVFAGSAAEFALNRAVDWLFFTGKVPGDPIGRLFETARYAQHIVFADQRTASQTLHRIRAVHEAVERERGRIIPDWAHRDVLYMLIDYSERAHELLARSLTDDERDELYDVFVRVGTGLGIPELPTSYPAWKADREHHLWRDLAYGEGTQALYTEYRRHLGAWRYRVLLRLQSVLAPEYVATMLGVNPSGLLKLLLRLYPVLVRVGLRSLIHRVLIPTKYLTDVRTLDHADASVHRAEAARPSRGLTVPS